MNTDIFSEMDREFYAVLLRMLAEHVNADLDDMAAHAAYRVAASFADKEQADDLQARLCPHI